LPDRIAEDVLYGALACGVEWLWRFVKRPSIDIVLHRGVGSVVCLVHLRGVVTQRRIMPCYIRAGL